MPHSAGVPEPTRKHAFGPRGCQPTEEANKWTRLCLGDDLHILSYPLVPRQYVSILAPRSTCVLYPVMWMSFAAAITRAKGPFCAMKLFGKATLNIKRNIICNAGQYKASHPRANLPGAPRCCEGGRRSCSREKLAQGMQLACSTYDAQLNVASTAIRSAAAQQLSAHRAHRQSQESCISSHVKLNALKMQL